MLLNTVSNGLGGQSMYLLWMATQGKITATVSITADTGSEEDRVLNTGERISARGFFFEYVLPMAEKAGIKASFVRAVDKDKNELPPLHEWMDREISRAQRGERKAKFGSQPAPMFGSKKGRLRQTCTDKWKIAAIKQEARRMGATHLRSAQGIHFGEADRRVRGQYLQEWEGYSLYQSGTKNRQGKFEATKWMTHYYPLVDLRMTRQMVRDELTNLGIPFLISSECDLCPHKDRARWLASSQETIDKVAALEARYGGDFFFTDRLIPLPMAIEEMRKEQNGKSIHKQGSLFDVPDVESACGDSYCMLT